MQVPTYTPLLSRMSSNGASIFIWVKEVKMNVPLPSIFLGALLTYYLGIFGWVLVLGFVFIALVVISSGDGFLEGMIFANASVQMVVGIWLLPQFIVYFGFFVGLLVFFGFYILQTIITTIITRIIWKIGG